MNNWKSKVLLLAAVLAAVAGCGSPKKSTLVDESADRIDQNRLMVRMALAENVYNGTATDRAVYPKDFDYGSASLNQLGRQRVEMLIHAYRGATGRIVVLRGDEPDDIHAERIEAVRQQFADAGFDKEKVIITRGGQLDPGSSSGRAIVSFDRLMSGYRAKESGAGGSASSDGGGTSIKD